MKGNVQVSVCCLTYNHEKYIRAALEGFVTQKTDFVYEVIVHDDASKDGTSKIIQEYAEKYPEIIKPIYQKENQYSKGIAIIKEYVLPVAQGRYIAMCEGDDFWNNPCKLQKQFDALEKYQECSISTHKVQCCNEDGSKNSRVIPEDKYKIRGEQIFDVYKLLQCIWLSDGYPFHTCSYFVRRCVFDVKLDYPRDVGLLRKAFLCGNLYYFDEEMSTRRLGSVEGWNARLEAEGKPGRTRLILGDIESEKIFDRVTWYRYHSVVEACNLKRVLYIAGYDADVAEKLIHTENFDFKSLMLLFPKFKLIKCIIKYYLLTSHPKILKILNKLKEKKS